MPNKNYLSGIRLERQLVNWARSNGKISGRMAGSHSPFDIYIFSPKKYELWFIQCKVVHGYKEAIEISNEKEYPLSHIKTFTFTKYYESRKKKKSRLSNRVLFKS